MIRNNALPFEKGNSELMFGMSEVLVDKFVCYELGKYLEGIFSSEAFTQNYVLIICSCYNILVSCGYGQTLSSVVFVSSGFLGG
ncbi:hypothetical protein R2TS_34290 [Enterobacter asburiae]|nr:hypothetical protein R2TS_34290 [Enterobacter asburiae]